VQLPRRIVKGLTTSHEFAKLDDYYFSDTHVSCGRIGSQVQITSQNDTPSSWQTCLLEGTAHDGENCRNDCLSWAGPTPAKYLVYLAYHDPGLTIFFVGQIRLSCDCQYEIFAQANLPMWEPSRTIFKV
jgi:hypothetical protein